MFLLYGGAMGGGKSYFLRWWCIREAMRLFAKYGVRGVRVGLFSMDYPTLRDRQISRIAFEVPEWLGKVHDSQVDGFSIVLAERWGSGVVVFRNLDNPSKYNSAEFAGIAVEELTENDEIVFNELRKRIRWPGIPQSDMHFVAAANPGGKGHAWVKKLWIDREYPPELQSLANEFQYVPAKASDNPHLDPDYARKNLDTLPDDMRKAYAEGSWDIFAGQYFTEWRKEVHVVEPFAIPWFWRIRRCGDWGEAKPCAHLWVAYSPEGEEFVIHEVYGAGKSIRQQASEILAYEATLRTQGHSVEVVGRAIDQPWGMQVDATGVLDAACWDVTGRAESIAQQFAGFGVHWMKSSKGPGSRVAGWNRVKKALHWTRNEDGSVRTLPRLRAFSTCANFVRTMPTLVHDKLKPEDLDSDGEDHAADAYRYGDEAPTIPYQTPASVMGADQATFMEYAREKMREAA